MAFVGNFYLSIRYSFNTISNDNYFGNRSTLHVVCKTLHM